MKAGVATATGSLAAAVAGWPGFAASLETGEPVQEQIRVGLFAVPAGSHLVALGLAGIIPAAWR